MTCNKSAQVPQPPAVVEVDYEDLRHMTPVALDLLRAAFVGSKAYGAIAVINIPGYGKKRREAFRAGINLALADPKGREKAAAVSNTYPGWSGTPGDETHPLQSSFLFNVKEEIPGGKTDPYFGKNTFPSEEYRRTFVDLATPMHNAALEVLHGCDLIMEELTEQGDGNKWSASGRSLHQLALEGPALAGRFICYDSGFTREDKLLSERENGTRETPSDPPDMEIKPAGHAGDGLASMRTHSTPVKSAGHAGDGLASMRTHSTPVKSAGHAGDGLASMRTHSTPVKSAGHAGDGLASMRTHSTPVKSAGHAGDGLASMRTHSTPVKSAGHAGDGLASMRTHSTPVKSAGHAGDGLASMRTHSTPVKSAGHAGDGLASMRTHSTPVKSAGHAGDGLASMRTHSTPVKSAGHAGDGLASMRTHSTPIKSAGHIREGSSAISAIPSSLRPRNADASASVRAHSSQTVPADLGRHSPELRFPGPEIQNSFLAEEESTGGDTKDQAAVVDNIIGGEEQELGDYWLPWHIDSNFITVLHKEVYAYESDTSFAPEPDGAGLLMMNEEGDVSALETRDDALIVQMGAFAQIYAGGYLSACRHAVRSPRPPGIARFNFCNFWYVPWNTLCNTVEGREAHCVNKGWNAMMDESYLNITMKQSFAAFRQFMTSPEARLQFADSVRFKELAELLPLPAAAAGASRSSKIVVDVLTDVRCPFSYISQTSLELALSNLGLSDRTVIRYHPLFLNPDVPKEGESLDDYLLREYGFAKEYAHSETYPLRLAGLEVGIRLNPNRRVVNTFDAHCLVELAQAQGKQCEAVRVLSRRYFENAEDISDAGVLRAVLAELGLEADAVATLQVSKSVAAKYTELSARVSEVPLFLIRESVSGNGLEVGGNRSVADWEGVLAAVLEKSRFVGMAVPGPDGKEVWLAEANPNAPVSLALPAQHGWAPDAWPYGPEHFTRMDESTDTLMYSEPRLVNHLDEASLARLTEVYRSAFKLVTPSFSVLDLCSSWTSHFPEEQVSRARVVVHGLNKMELDANKQATERHVQDLNGDPRLPWLDGSFDFVTLALSVQYLTDPRAVFSEMHRVLRPGGMALVAFSHRCFIEKCVHEWVKEINDGEGHAHLICRYFQYGPRGGWVQLSSSDVSPRHGDPLWVVTAVKAGQQL